jgi:hypothetical protein
MQRWTIRGVSPDVIRAVQALRAETDANLGEIVSASIQAGLAAARREIQEGSDDERESSRLAQATQEALADLRRAIWPMLHTGQKPTE